MSQPIFTPADALAIYPDAQYARTYTYPSCGITGLGVCEWGLERRAIAHTKAGHWVGGYPTRHPDRGLPLYLSDTWTTPCVFLVASEREAFGLQKIGVNATTWIGQKPGEMRLSDWGVLDGKDVRVWLPDAFHKVATSHLWRHRFVPDIGKPLDWLRSAWEKHKGNVDAIREDLFWLEGI